eukprot:scaffold115637_cov45-Attheya_sp.AAC.4
MTSLAKEVSMKYMASVKAATWALNSNICFECTFFGITNSSINGSPPSDSASCIKWAINGGPDPCGTLDGVPPGTIGPFVSIDSANPAILVPLAALLDGPSLLLPRVGPLRPHEWPLPPRPLPTVDSAPRPPSTTFSKYLHTWAEYLVSVVAVVAVAVVKEDGRGRHREWWCGVVGRMIWRRRGGLRQRGWRVGE